MPNVFLDGLLFAFKVSSEM